MHGLMLLIVTILGCSMMPVFSEDTVPMESSALNVRGKVVKILELREDDIGYSEEPSRMQFRY